MLKNKHWRVAELLPFKVTKPCLPKVFSQHSNKHFNIFNLMSGDWKKTWPGRHVVMSCCPRPCLVLTVKIWLVSPSDCKGSRPPSPKGPWVLLNMERLLLKCYCNVCTVIRPLNWEYLLQFHSQQATRVWLGFLCSTCLCRCVKPRDSSNPANSKPV